jgi:hypothetical protein
MRLLSAFLDKLQEYISRNGKHMYTKCERSFTRVNDRSGF